MRHADADWGNKFVTSAQYALNSLEIKLLPLSVMILCETPNRKTMPLTKLIVDAASGEVIGFASIHLVNLSTAPSIYTYPPGHASCNFLTISRPHCVKGHDKGIGISSAAGEWGFAANL
jgi:hypothetical protein